jgi:hypothetical protein
MSPGRRRARGAYRPPRSRREVLTAVAAVVGVLLVTAALIWFLRPGDSDSEPEQPSISAPVSLPTPSLPADTAPPAPPPASTP